MNKLLIIFLFFVSLNIFVTNLKAEIICSADLTILKFDDLTIWNDENQRFNFDFNGNLLDSSKVGDSIFKYDNEKNTLQEFTRGTGSQNYKPSRKYSLKLISETEYQKFYQVMESFSDNEQYFSYYKKSKGFHKVTIAITGLIDEITPVIFSVEGKCL